MSVCKVLPVFPKSVSDCPFLDFVLALSLLVSGR